MSALCDLKGRTAVITGGGTGIGRAVAFAFARSGSDIVLVYNQSREQTQEAAEIIRGFGRRAAVVQADVTQEQQVERMVREAGEFNGALDIVLNNAGTMVGRQTIDEMELSLWSKVMDVNVTSVFLVSKHASRVMKHQRSGRIINITSVSARNGGSLGGTAYAAAKGAVSTFTKGLAKELAPYGVLVNAIAPGVITTRFHDQYTSAETREHFKRIIPLGREGRPDEVAGAALLLASDYGSYITGETIEVNGGLLMD